MIQFIFSRLWIAILAILFVIVEFECWSSAIHKYKVFRDTEALLDLIIAHAVGVGCVSFIYWIILLFLVAK